jgi:SepF-like predicted cell division protein (DUF552 family)
MIYQEKYLYKKVIETLKDLSQKSWYISNENILMTRTTQLLKKIEILKERYQ